MVKTMHNYVVLMRRQRNAWENSSKVGMMCMNRFTIDEDVAFELSGVDYGNRGKEYSIE